MKWWIDSNEKVLAQAICDKLDNGSEASECSTGAKFPVGSVELGRTISFLWERKINFWTSYENKESVIYIFKQ